MKLNSGDLEMIRLLILGDQSRLKKEDKETTAWAQGLPSLLDKVNAEIRDQELNSLAAVAKT